jgi:1-acyl-sn-glycerol-3-phosphate acyltransferase
MWLSYRIVRIPFALLAKTKKYNLKVQGVENVPTRGPLIVVANHQSSADIIAIALALKPLLKNVQMVPWAKKEIGEGKEGILGKWLYNFFGVIPIDREGKNIEEAIEKSHKYLREGKVVCIFPEGTRHKHKELGKFEYGVANLARSVPVPILPIGVYWRKEEDGGIQVNIGKPFYLPPRKKRYQFLEKKEENIEKLVTHIDNLREWLMSFPLDNRGTKAIKNVTSSVIDFLTNINIDFGKICRLGEKEDLERIRKEVLSLLPSDWKLVD